MTEGKTNIKIIILGAGVTGLSAGIRFLENGCDVCVVEKSEHVGGLAKTAIRGNYLLDLGPHHLYSDNESILNEMLDLFQKDEIVRVSLRVKILFHDRFLNYPLTAKTVLSKMGFKHALYGSLSYVWMALRNLLGLGFKEESFHAWARNNFGDYLYNIFFKPYTEQFWGVPCEEMSIDCIPQVKKSSFMQTLKKVFLEKFANERLSASEHDIAWEKSANFYPIKGFGAVAEKLKDSFLSKGGTLRLNCDISELAKNENSTYTIHYSNGVESFKEEAVYVVSTIPLPSLFQILKPAPPASVVLCADSLKYLSVVVLYVVIHDRDILDTSFVYMVDRPYNRLSNTNRLQPNLCPEGENMLVCEITCSFNDETWKSSDEEIFENCISHLESDNLISRKEVKQFFTVRAKNAYPFYRLGYKENLNAVFEYFKQTPNIALAGRVGAFKYMDTHECLADTVSLVEELKSKGTI
jgi:protoporphyrinogen oxidase